MIVHSTFVSLQYTLFSAIIVKKSPGIQVARAIGFHNILEAFEDPDMFEKSGVFIYGLP